MLQILLMFNSKTLLKIALRFGLHILFWIVVLLFYTYFFGFGSENLRYVLSFALFLMPITIILTYVFIYKLIPQYLLKKHYFKFARYSIYAMIISAYLLGYCMFFGLIFLSDLDAANMSPISKNLIFVMLGVYLVVVVVSSFKLLQLYYKGSVENSALRTKILESQFKLKEQELNYLKMQIHPHFLFNTLNTIYGFALKKADEAPEMILKLSNLLDYLLYQIDRPQVLLSSEIDHIKDYIDLELLRFRDTLSVDMEIGKYPEGMTVPPMLFLPFVENSFKHGQMVDGRLKVDINLTYINHDLKFKVKNSVSENQTINYGLGLENLKRRLQMLYPNSHELEIESKPNHFIARLILKGIK